MVAGWIQWPMAPLVDTSYRFVVCPKGIKCWIFYSRQTSFGLASSSPPSSVANVVCYCNEMYAEKPKWKSSCCELSHHLSKCVLVLLCLSAFGLTCFYYLYLSFFGYRRWAIRSKLNDFVGLMSVHSFILSLLLLLLGWLVPLITCIWALTGDTIL